MTPYALTASSGGTFTITVDPKSCGSNLDPPKEEDSAPQPPRATGPDPAKRRAAKAARKARKHNR